MANQVYDPKSDEERAPATSRSPDQTTPSPKTYDPRQEGSMHDSSDPRMQKSAADKSELYNAEKGKAASKSTEASEEDGPPRGIKQKLKGTFNTRRKKQIAIGSGITGLIVSAAFGGFTILQGPAQAIQLSQWLGTNASGDEDSSSKSIRRLYRFARTGDISETRVGEVGSRRANDLIKQLGDIGIEYERGLAGQVNSVKVDTDKLSKRYPELKNMSQAESKAYISKKFDIPQADLKNLSSSSGSGGHKFTYDTRDLGIKESRALVKGNISALEDGKIVSAMKLRALAKFFNLPSLFHPIKKVSASEEIKLARVAEQRIAEEKRASTRTVPESPEVKAAKSNLKDNLSTKAKVSGGALLFTSAMCIARDVADSVVVVNRAMVVGPSVIEAEDKAGVGSQAMAGQDITLTQLGAVVNSFKDKDGNTIWDSKPLQATIDPGTTKGTELPVEFQQAFGADNTAANIKNGVGGGTIGAIACSPVGVAVQTIGGVIILASGFADFGGSWAAYASAKSAELAAGMGAMHLLQTEFTNILKDKAIVPKVFSGPVGGGLMAYGAREGENIKDRASGGIELSASQSTAIDHEQELKSHREFRNKPFFAQMFDLHDYRAPIARMTRSLNSNPGDNIATMAQSIVNVPRLISSSFASLLPKASAGTTYQWPSNRVGIPKDLMDDPTLQDPYENAGIVTTILRDSGGENSPYIDRVMNCFGNKLSKGSSGWEPSLEKEVNPNDQSYLDARCNNRSDGDWNDWKRIIMFVYYSHTMDTVDCYAGDSDSSAESCANIGVQQQSAAPSATSSASTAATNSTSSSSSPGSGGTISGSSQELAKELIKSGRLTDQDGRYIAQIKAIANGDASCNVNPDIIKMLNGIVVKDKHKVVMSSLNRFCTHVILKSGTASYHYADGGGHAIDVVGFDGGAVNGSSPASVAYVREAIKYIPSGDVGIGQIAYCGAGFTLPAGVRSIPDECNHVHIQVPTKQVAK